MALPLVVSNTIVCEHQDTCSFITSHTLSGDQAGLLAMETHRDASERQARNGNDGEADGVHIGPRL